MTAREHLAAIRRNVEAFYDGIDHSTFSVRARRLWDQVAADGMTDEVLALMRQG